MSGLRSWCCRAVSLANSTFIASVDEGRVMLVRARVSTTRRLAARRWAQRRSRASQQDAQVSSVLGSMVLQVSMVRADYF